jgi:hypothetical protein
MTWGMVAIAGAGLAGGLIASSGAQSAASTQADAANRAADLQKQQFDQQMALQDPFRTAGLTAQNALLQKLGLGGDANAPGYGQYAKDFSMADYQADPGYAFRLSEGMKQLGSQARARGGAVGGRTMMAGQQYAQDLASQEYQGAFNRYQTNRANQLQPLGSLVSSGQAAASNQAGQAGQYGVNAGNLMTQAGQSVAAGQLGAANSLAGAITGGASAYQQQTNFNNWLARQSKSPVYTTTPSDAPTNYMGF